MAVAPRIERAEVIPVRIPMAGGRSRESVILRLRAEGLDGLGEAPVLSERGHRLEDVCTELATAAAALSTGAAAALGLMAPVAAAIETATLDLEARAAGVPLVERLGGPRRQAVRCNALIDAAGPERVAADVELWAAQGFTAFKLKSANRGGPVDAERLGAARYAAGAGAELRIDFNGGLSPPQAAAVLPALREFQVRFVEQPLSPDEPVDAWLRLQALQVRLLADESLADAQLAGELAERGLGLAIKLATVGGPARALRLASQATGPVLVSSSFETSIGIAAGLHAAAALSGVEACGLATASLLEADPAHGLRLDADRMPLPNSPGLGVELDEAVLAAYRLDR